MDEPNIVELHRKYMERVPETKTWSVPCGHGTGAAIMSMRLPDVTITDTEGRHVVLTPKQCAVLGRRMAETLDWLEELDFVQDEP